MADVCGLTYDNLKFRMMGFRINAEKYDHDYGDEASTPGFDAAGNIVRLGYGSNKLVNWTFDFAVEEFRKIEDPCFAVGKKPTKLWPFPITVEYWNNKKSGNFLAMEADAIHTRTLVNSKIEDISAAHARGDGKLIQTVKGVATDIA